jgi:Ca-activated chloride channel family protein
MTLAIQTDRTLIRAAASSTRYVLARITAPRAPERDMRLPVNVGIVLDRSGSMAAERKFELAREAVEQSLRMLRADDRFALVVYDSEIDVLMQSTRATPEMARRALDALRESVGSVAASRSPSFSMTIG